MKVTHSWYGKLRDFDAWDAGKDNLDALVNTGFIDKAESLAEDNFRDGVEDEELNDWLACLDEDYPEWFNENWDEMQEAIQKIEAMPKPWFTESGGDPVTLWYETDDDDARHFQIYAGPEPTPGNIHSISSMYYDFGKTFDENLDELKRLLMTESDIYEQLPPELEYVEDFPTWAVCYCMYGDATGISGADQRMVDEWMEENGYGKLVSAHEETLNEFNRYPAFGLACGTETVVMRKIEGEKDEA